MPSVDNSTRKRGRPANKATSNKAAAKVLKVSATANDDVNAPQRCTVCEKEGAGLCACTTCSKVFCKLHLTATPKGHSKGHHDGDEEERDTTCTKCGRLCPECWASAPGMEECRTCGRSCCSQCGALCNGCDSFACNGCTYFETCDKCGWKACECCACGNKGDCPCKEEEEEEAKRRRKKKAGGKSGGGPRAYGGAFGFGGGGRTRGGPFGGAMSWMQMW